MPPLARCLLRAALVAVSLGVAFLVGEPVWRAIVSARYAADREAFAARSAAGAPEVAMFELTAGDELYGLRRGCERTETIADPAGGPPTTVRYRILDDGVRAHPQWPPPAGADTSRLMFVGDSYTFGSAVGEGEAFPHRVDEALRARGVPAFAIDAGVPGYNAAQTLVRLRTLLPRYEPRHVVFAFVTNDAEPPIGVRVPLDEVYGAARSWLWEDGKRIVNALVAALVDDTPWLARAEPVYEKDYRRSWGPGSPKARACLQAIGAMAAACSAHGAGFTVAIVPDFARDLDDRYPYLDLHRQVGAFCRQQGIAVLDLLDAVRGADVTELRVPGDLHPNAEGHRRLAAPLADHLAERLRG